jgi:hypothetical protein
VIFDVISAALTGVTKNSEKIRANLFIFSKPIEAKDIYSTDPLDKKMDRCYTK